MTDDFAPYHRSRAIDDFRRARNQAVLKELLARLKGEKRELLSYEEVRKNLKVTGSAERGLKEIPLDAIVGSVNRYSDFTRDFLPRGNVNAQRWAEIELLTTRGSGLPPIDVYQIGDTYFVKDGNHRVSVAHRVGAKYIQAYVTEVVTRVPLSPETSPDDLIIKAEYAEFLEHTQLDDVRPEAEVSLTVPGEYPVLEEHIAVHRYYMGLEEKRFISMQEAAADWYDTIYLPVIQVIRRTGVLRDFPGRTETDLYLWIVAHRATLEESLGREIRPEDAADDLVTQFSSQISRRTARLTDKLKETLLPSTLETGPSTGQWRRGKLAARPEDRLFADILVPISGEPESWSALEQAIVIGRREDSTLHGLFVSLSEPERSSLKALAVEEEFIQRCELDGVSGRLLHAVGEISRQISDHARWSDLVVVHLAHPPASQPLAALSSGFKALIQRSPRPLLAVPGAAMPLKSALLAYDGSPKSKEALYVAAYLAGQWKIPLYVITVFEKGRVQPETLAEAWHYLESNNIEATYIKRDSGPVAELILAEAEAHNCDLLLMGGYVYPPLLDVVLGNEVDKVLRESHKPVLICR